MQSLGVISINIWQALISLANLVILFFVMKKFLFKPVRKVLEQRQAHVDGVYAQADEARAKAEADRDAWNARMQGAREEADRILSAAAENARLTGDAMICEAKNRAQGILQEAEDEAEQTRRVAAQDIRREMAGLSAELAEKLLGREINEADHRQLIDSFLNELEEQHDTNQ